MSYSAPGRPDNRYGIPGTPDRGEYGTPGKPDRGDGRGSPIGIPRFEKEGGPRVGIPHGEYGNKLGEFQDLLMRLKSAKNK